MKVEVKNLEGKVVEELDLNPGVFAVEINEELLHQVYVGQYANKRRVTAHTKTRGEIKGSTKKPWKQKGTGRARTGDVKNPIWRKGGTVFGPRKDRNYSQKINKKVARLAVKMALSAKVQSGDLVVVDSYELKDIKTALMAKAVEKLGLKNNILFAFEEGARKYARATGNLAESRNIDIELLNVFDILNAKQLVLSKEGVKFLEQKYNK
jgi:large subunit ribosomal protein L4